MQKFKTTTRGIVSILRASSDMRIHLGLHKVPVHTTIVRFIYRIKKFTSKFLKIREANTVAVDSTGFELESKSYYYRTVWNSNKKQKTRKFMKLSIAVDTDKKLILTHKIRKSRAHDTRDFKGLTKTLKCDHVVADKGYDSRDLRKFVILKLKAKPHIPYRNISGRAKKGRFIDPLPKKEIYNKRPIVENIFFCIKNKYGSILRNKSLATQKVELISKMIAYNLDRKQSEFVYFLRVAPTHD